MFLVAELAADEREEGDGQEGRHEGRDQGTQAGAGPRGEHLERHGVVLEDGSTVMLVFAEFEITKGETGWTTICVAHGTRHPAGTKAEAEKAGARKARAGWCKGCAKAPRRSQPGSRR